MKKIIAFIFGIFMMLGLASCGESLDDYNYKVVAPSGAPAVAVAGICDNTHYKFVSADTIGAQFTAEDKADFIIAPINAGAKLFKLGKSSYKLGAVVTWGNIYFATQRSDVSSINDLAGKTVTLFGAGTINESIAKYVLAQKNIEVTYADALGSAAIAGQKLASNSEGIYLTAEPVLSKISDNLAANNKTVTSFAVADLYKEISDNDGYAQAGLFINQDTITNHKSVVDKYLAKVKESCNLVSTSLDTVAEACVKYSIIAEKNLAIKAIPNCKISYKSAKDSKAIVEATANIDLSQFGGALPLDEFYYA